MMSRVPVSRRANRASYLAGSERLLRVHHKNSVFSRDLQHSLENLDIACRKNLSKFQQTIFDVYHNEFVPIREQANALRLPKLPLTVLNVRADDRTLMYKTVNDRRETRNNRKSYKTSPSDALPCTKNRTSETKALPLAISSCELSVEKDEPSMYTCSLKQVLELPPIMRQNVGRLWSNELNKTSMLLSDSDIEDGPDVDSEILKRIKKAIALTSQPSKPKVSRKDKMLRRSFLLSLRRTSKSVWHNEMLQRVGGDTDRESGKDRAKSPSDTLLREAKLAKLLMLSTSNTSLKRSVTMSDSMSETEGRQSNYSFCADRFQAGEKIYGSDISSDDDAYTESPTYFSEISEDPSFLANTDTETTSSYSSYSDSSEST